MNDSTAPRLTWADLPGLFPGFPGAERWLTLLQRHAALVEAWRPHVNLTSVGPAEAVRRNYAESLETWRIACGHGAPSVAVDVGPGAGFPGLVAAVVSPACQVHLVEPLKKRSRFLVAAVEELGLVGVAVHPVRAEEAGRGALRQTADVVVARAVAALPELLEYVAPLASLGGHLVLPKGQSAPGEVAAAAYAAAVLGVGLAGIEPMRTEVSDTPWAVVYRKIAPTPDAYPRREGIPRRRPL